MNPLCRFGFHWWKLSGYYAMYERRVFDCAHCPRRRVEGRLKHKNTWRTVAIFPSRDREFATTVREPEDVLRGLVDA